MGNGLVTVEPVESRSQLRRFADVPYLLFGDDERWSPGVRAYESWRIDARRNPYFGRGDAAFLLARRAGRPVGRIAAHRPGPAHEGGCFGFFDVPDDAAATTALLDAARSWLREEGASTMTGPVSWRPEEDFGVPVHGFEHRGLTGRPWRPGWYAEQLRAAGLEPGEVRHTYRLSTAASAPAVPQPVPDELPPHAGGYGDPALVLDGIAAVPDVSGTLARASLRSAWRVARRAKDRAFDTAVCVRCNGDPVVLVPQLLSAARHAGYAWAVVPWAPAGTEPETSHQVFTAAW